MGKEVIDWALNLVGYSGPHAEDFLESGGTMAGFIALVAARDAKLDFKDVSKGTVYLTDQTHTANHKCLHLMGIPR